MRCRTLGEELRRRGWSASIATRSLPPALAESFRESGIEVIDIPAEIPVEKEAGYIGRKLDRRVALVVVDSYEVGADWERAAGVWTERIMAIDDLADRSHAVDMLLNQNLGASEARYRGRVPAGTRLLCGPTYALIRPEFEIARQRSRARSGRIDRIIVFMSGADGPNITRAAAAAVFAVGIPADVVVGAAYPYETDLREWMRQKPHLQLHVNVPWVAQLMAQADLAIGAPSSASWERCTLGLPTVLVTLADNQREVAQLLADAGAAVSLGWHETVSTADLRTVLTDLSAHPERVRAMSEASARITDGRGTVRVADALDLIVRKTTVVSQGDGE